MTDNNDSAPQFNFDDVSMRWGAAWQKTLTRATELQLGLQELAADEEPDALAAARKQVDLMHELEAVAAEQRNLLAQVLVDVPRDWLSSDAPDGLNWADSAAYDYILERRFGELITHLTAARRQVPKA